MKFNENFTAIGNNIHVYKNFLSNDECLNIVKLLDAVEESEWRPPHAHFENTMKTCDQKPQLIWIRDRINSILNNDFYLNIQSVAPTRMTKNQFWGVHADVNDFADIEKRALAYVDGMDYEEMALPFYGLVLYFNEFEGGEIYYPSQNIVYKPNSGDLVIHGSGVDCEHGVKTVLSEKRYTYTNNILKKIKVAK